MSHLFLFTISPVQSFITQARKTQDLYAGSQLLSDLCKVGVETVKEQYHGNIIFPNKDNEFFPNRFLAEVPEQSTHFEEIGKAIELKVKKYFEGHSERTLENILRQQKFPEDFDRPKFEKQFKNQISNHLDIHWVFYPVGNDYAHAYREIEKLLGAIKNVRTFDQLRTFDQFGEMERIGEMGRKCSLDGERNALFYRCKNDGKALAHIKHNVKHNGALKLRGEYKFKLTPGEALSAVSFVKRCYKPEEFDSTATIALMKYLEKCKKDRKGRELLVELCDLLGKKCIDDIETQLFYEENLTPKYFEKNDLDDHIQEISEIQKIVKKLDDLKLAKKTRYYALIAFDGDNMGKWLSGDLTDKTRLKEFHSVLSQKLGEFAKLASGYLQKPRGQAIYAGGDDFLGFVNLNHLFEVMKHLRESFECTVNKPLKEKFSFKEKEKKLTFSAGIVIAHYKMPLHIVLLKARALEKVAKNDGDRDAFAIGVMKHSGESLQICYKWQDNEEWNIDRIYRVIEQLQENFSDTFIRNLDSELRLLIDEKGYIKDSGLVRTEIKRLMKRSLEDGKSESLVDGLYDNVGKLLSSNRKIDNFLETLSIAIFLQRETK